MNCGEYSLGNRILGVIVGAASLIISLVILMYLLWGK